MTGLGPEASALLEAARCGDEPTDADRERVRAAIATRLAAGAAAGIGAMAAGKWAGSTLGAAGGAPASAAIPAGLAAKALAAAILVGALGASAVLIHRALPHPVAPLSVPAHPTVAVGVDGPVSARGSPNGATNPTAPPIDDAHGVGFRSGARAVPGSVIAPAVSSSAHTTVATGDVAAEVRLLGEAHAVMRRGDAERALVLLDEHARRYPKGALGEERDAARIAALCALGRVAEARETADRFLRAAPQSPHAGPIRASCGGPLSTPAP
jgi:hypothetical protein